MNEDDLMPNDGYFVPREPAEQIISRKKERAKTLESLNVLKSIVERLEFRINYYNTLDSIPDDVKKDPQKFLIMYNSNKMVVENLRQEKAIIESLIDSNAPNR